jgi:hypothetical protein
MIGDILQDDNVDEANFKLCNGDKMAIQYYALGEKTYDGEKIAIERIFKSEFNPTIVKKESGLVRIRFMVNCEGESGRFRLLATDHNYQAKTFDTKLTDQLMRITKNLKGWKGFTRKGIGRDYYQYLIFKIKDGNILEIMP